MSDEELIIQADEAIEGERLLVAGRLLRQVKEESSLTPFHQAVMKKAEIAQQVIDVHIKPAHDDPTWKRQSEMHGDRDTIIYYKMEGRSKLTCRIETPIETSLLVPLLAVCNESEIYDTWMPRWTFPVKLGVRQSIKLADLRGRGEQVVQVTVDMPFPIANREVVYSTTAVDAIDELGIIAVTALSLEEGMPIQQSADQPQVPPPEKDITRIDYESSFTFRRCPPDHPCLKESKHKGESLILVTVTMFTDAHVGYVPLSVINFTTRVALGGQWGALLQVAQDVKEGKRPDHVKAIHEKPELYDWVNQRIAAMCSKIDDTNGKEECSN